MDRKSTRRLRLDRRLIRRRGWMSEKELERELAALPDVVAQDRARRGRALRAVGEAGNASDRVAGSAVRRRERETGPVIKAKLGDRLDEWLRRLLPFLFRRRLNPNVLTVVGALVSLVAAVAFSAGYFVTGGVLMLVGGALRPRRRRRGAAATASRRASAPSSIRPSIASSTWRCCSGSPCTTRSRASRDACCWRATCSPPACSFPTRRRAPSWWCRASGWGCSSAASASSCSPPGRSPASWCRRSGSSRSAARSRSSSASRGLTGRWSRIDAAERTGLGEDI